MEELTQEFKDRCVAVSNVLSAPIVAKDFDELPDMIKEEFTTLYQVDPEVTNVGIHLCLRQVASIAIIYERLRDHNDMINRLSLMRLPESNFGRG